MPSHLALLRGVNVGGRNKVPMPALRELVAGLGHGDVSTYIQSGNVMFSASSPSADPVALAGALERAVAEEFGVASDVVVVTEPALAAVIAANPYPDEEDGKRLHAVFRRDPLTEEGVAAVAAAVAKAREAGSKDSATVVGATTYLHVPDGLGRSVLAELLARPATARRVGGPGTARNWSTVTTLHALLTGAK